MKISVRIFALVVFVLFTTHTKAQTKFGIRGGLNFSTFSIAQDGATVTPDSKTSFNLGIISEIPLSTDLYLQPGILFSGKGSKTSSISTLSTNNIEIPINALYKLKTAGSIKVLGFAGPYIGYAVNGKSKLQGITSDITFSGNDKAMNAFDCGLNFGVGVEIKSFQITAQYGLGLTNLAPNSSNGTVKNKVFGVSLSYLFINK